MRTLLISLVLTFLLVSCKNPLEHKIKIQEFDETSFQQNLESDLLDRLEDNDNDHQANYLLAEYYFNQAEYQRALPYIENALILEKSDPSYKILHIRILAQLNRTSETKTVLNKLETEHPEYLYLYIAGAEIYLKEKQPDSAAHYIRALKRIDKGRKEIDYYSALNYLNANDTTDAIKAYYSAIKSWENNINLYYDLSSLLIAKGNYKSAYQIIQKASNQFETTQLFQEQMADVIYLQNLTDSAFTAYKALFMKDTSNLRLSVKIADLYAEQNQEDSARHYLTKAIDYPEENIPLKIADSYFNQYKNKQALVYYELALQKDSTSEYIKTQISRSKWRINYINNSNLSSDNNSESESEEKQKQTVDTLQ